MTEVQMATAFKKALYFIHPSAHYQRIENSVGGNGLPDINICHDGGEIWIELKSKSGDVMDQLRPSQKVWMTQRVLAGGRVFVVNKSPNYFEFKVFRMRVVVAGRLWPELVHVTDTLAGAAIMICD